MTNIISIVVQNKEVADAFAEAVRICFKLDVICKPIVHPQVTGEQLIEASTNWPLETLHSRKHSRKLTDLRRMCCRFGMVLRQYLKGDHYERL